MTSEAVGEVRRQASFVVESRELDGIQQLLVDVVAAGANEILMSSSPQRTTSSHVGCYGAGAAVRKTFQP